MLCARATTVREVQEIESWEYSRSCTFLIRFRSSSGWIPLQVLLKLGLNTIDGGFGRAPKVRSGSALHPCASPDAGDHPLYICGVKTVYVHALPVPRRTRHGLFRHVNQCRQGRGRCGVAFLLQPYIALKSEVLRVIPTRDVWFHTELLGSCRVTGNEVC